MTRPVHGEASLAPWRRWLFAWLARREAPEARALGLPHERVVTVERVVDLGAAPR